MIEKKEMGQKKQIIMTEKFQKPSILFPPPRETLFPTSIWMRQVLGSSKEGQKGKTSNILVKPGRRSS